MTTQLTAFGTLRVLLVEDEALIAEGIRERLSRLGADQVEVCDTGETALRLIGESDFDVVLLDIRLKGQLDGIEVARKIQAERRLPIVFLTAHSDEATLSRALESEPYGYLLKPFSERELYVAIEIAISRFLLIHQLRESEGRYLATLSSIGDAVLATDPNGRVTFINRVAEVLTGWRAEAARERNVDEVLTLRSESTGEPIPSPVLRAMEERSTVFITEPTLLVTRSGMLIPVDDSAAPVLDDYGNILGGVIAFRDIRDRRLAEAALSEAREQLRLAQKMEAIGRVTAAIAHDFSNFLTVVGGSSELLLGREGLDATSRSLALEIQTATDRASSLVRELLTIGRMERARASHPIDVVGVLLGIRKLVERLVGPRIEVDFDLPDGTPPVLGDETELEQVVLNLAANSRDAMDAGGALRISVEREQLDPKAIEAGGEEGRRSVGRHVRISVADEGSGMDQHTQDRAFEPYFTTKAEGEGTGLGLATVYSTLEKWGGYARLRSQPGVGTTIDLYVPEA